MFSDQKRSSLTNEISSIKKTKCHVRRCSAINQIGDFFRLKIKNLNLDKNWGTLHNKRMNRICLSKISNSTDIINEPIINMISSIRTAKDPPLKNTKNRFTKDISNKSSNKVLSKMIKVFGEQIKLR